MNQPLRCQGPRPLKILAIVLAGGKGTRLRPLTAEHAKPALPFVAGYRIIDFVLSNLVNSGISSIYVLMQYKPKSLMEHIHDAWTPWAEDHGITISSVLPEGGGASAGFKGTADAVYQNLHLIERHQPDLVAVFASDHIYRMDVRKMARHHQERKAQISIAAVRVPIAQASAFGIMAVDRTGELREFREKPERPDRIPDDPTHAYASMGNYLFNPRILVSILEDANRRGAVDFGRDLIPRILGRYRVLTYDFASSAVPGVQPFEERGYWRDIGAIEAYRAAQRDALAPVPRFRLDNSEWPIRGGASAKSRYQASESASHPSATQRHAPGAGAIVGLGTGDPDAGISLPRNHAATVNDSATFATS